MSDPVHSPAPDREALFAEIVEVCGEDIPLRAAEWRAKVAQNPVAMRLAVAKLRQRLAAIDQGLSPVQSRAGWLHRCFHALDDEMRGLRKGKPAADEDARRPLRRLGTRLEMGGA